MTATLTDLKPINSIEEGLIIDHIPAGNAFKIIELLQRTYPKNLLIIGLNLQSQKMGLKDLIKINGAFTSEFNLECLATLAPKATLSMINNHQVIEKITLESPSHIEHFFKCPNSKCITSLESCRQKFEVINTFKKTELKCYYCQQLFSPHTLELSYDSICK